MYLLLIKYVHQAKAQEEFVFLKNGDPLKNLLIII